MTKIKNNWYEILEIDYYYNPEEKKQIIENIIDEKNKYWVKNKEDRRFGTDYKRYIREKRKILNDILDYKKRLEMLKEIREKAFRIIKENLESFSTNLVLEKFLKEITVELAEDYEPINENIVKEWIWNSEKKITVSSYDEFKEKIDKKISFDFDDIDKDLKILGKNNIYEFLNSKSLALNFLNKQEVEEKIKNLNKNNFQENAEINLYLFCQNLIEKNLIEEYNDYLNKIEFLKIKEELENLKKEFESEVEKNVESQIKKFTSNFKDMIKEETAREIFLKYFGIENKDDKKEIEQHPNKLKKKSKKRIILLVFIGIVFFTVAFLGKNMDTLKKKYLYKKMANKGNTEAMNKLVEIYSKEGNLHQLKYWYEKMANKGDSGAIDKLAEIYYQEGNVERLKYWANKGNMKAMDKLTFVYSQEDDLEQVEYWYEKMANKGNIEAMGNLGNCFYEYGDKEKAKYWYEKASNNGNIDSMKALGGIYQKEKNNEKAKYWYEKAAIKGDKDAMYFLKEIYKGEGNMEKAKYWYEKSGQIQWVNIY